MVDTAGKHALLQAIVHLVVCLVVRVAHVGSVSKRSNLEVAVEWCSEVFVMDFKAVILVVLAATVVSVSSLLSCVTLEFSLLHEIRAFNIQVLFFIDAHMFEEVSYLPFEWVDSGAYLVKTFFICRSLDCRLGG